jgi:hypothetical protein
MDTAMHYPDIGVVVNDRRSSEVLNTRAGAGIDEFSGSGSGTLFIRLPDACLNWRIREQKLRLGPFS